MAWTKADIKREAEANYFACCLLMPADMFISEYHKVLNVHEDKRVQILSDLFEVPDHAVIHRISHLKDRLLDLKPKTTTEGLT